MSVVDLQLNCTFSRNAVHIERRCFLLDDPTHPGRPGRPLWSCGSDMFSDPDVINPQCKQCFTDVGLTDRLLQKGRNRHVTKCEKRS